MPKIRSNPSKDSGKPWFNFTFDEVNMKVGFQEANGLSNFPERVNGASLQSIRKNAPFSISLNANKSSEIHVLAVTLDGSLEFVPESELKPVYYAHLGTYDPNTGKVDMLEFVEE